MLGSSELTYGANLCRFPSKSTLPYGLRCADPVQCGVLPSPSPLTDDRPPLLPDVSVLCAQKLSALRLWASWEAVDWYSVAMDGQVICNLPVSASDGPLRRFCAGLLSIGVWNLAHQQMPPLFISWSPALAFFDDRLSPSDFAAVPGPPSVRIAHFGGRQLGSWLRPSPGVSLRKLSGRLLVSLLNGRCSKCG
jgi:hypothetical protein